MPSPFPEIDCEAQAIILTGFAFFSILFLLILMVLMIYFYSRHKYQYFLPILVVFLFSLIIGFYSLASKGFPFTPYFQLFFMLIQTVFFILHALEFFK